MTTTDKLKLIVPGKTYPAYVKVEEKDNDGKDVLIEFHLNSFYVGMYSAVHINGAIASQNGDYDNKRFTRGLKKYLTSAITRGAKN